MKKKIQKNPKKQQQKPAKSVMSHKTFEKKMNTDFTCLQYTVINRMKHTHL